MESVESKLDLPTGSRNAAGVPTILQTTPPLPAFAEAQFVLPDFGGVTADEIGTISPH